MSENMTQDDILRCLKIISLLSQRRKETRKYSQRRSCNQKFYFNKKVTKTDSQIIKIVDDSFHN